MERQKMTYVILFDALECRTRTTTTSELLERYPHPFRLLDGDGTVCYYGRSHSCDDEAAFAPLDWAKADSGCTTVEYLDTYGDWIPL